MRKIAETISPICPLARQRHDPVARASCNIEKPLILGLLEGFQVCLHDVACPDNDAVVFIVCAAAAGKIEIVCPAVFLKFWRLVSIEPLQAVHGLCPVVAMPRG